MRSLATAALVLGGLLAASCTNPAPQQTAPPAPAAPAEPPGPLTIQPGISINAVMVALVDHAGHTLWEAERPNQAPKSDGDWRQLSEHAVQLSAAAAAISVGGTGPSDPVWVRSAQWKEFAQKMSDAGLAASTAARNKDITALVSANGQLVESCESCHKVFKPELPTEGIVHSHKH